MTFWKKLFGRKGVEGYKPSETKSEVQQVSEQAEKPIVKAGTAGTQLEKTEAHVLPISPEASLLISEALKIIEAHVEITPERLVVTGGGSEGDHHGSHTQT